MPIRRIIKPMVIERLPLDNSLLEEAYDAVVAGSTPVVSTTGIMKDNTELDPTAPIKNEADRPGIDDGDADEESGTNAAVFAELQKAYNTGVISKNSNYKLIIAMHIAQSVAKNLVQYPDLVRKYGTQIGKLYTS